jgi:phosphoserine phosphatase RsbU/P
MVDYNHSIREEPKLRDILRDDLRRGDFTQTLRRDYQDLKDFFLSENRKNRLKEMNWFRRGIYTFGWLLKSLFLKLTPIRRILLVIGIVLLIVPRNIGYQGDSVQFETNFVVLGGVTLLFILMLELKDKLLARNELEAGRAVQHALMPERNPSVPGWSIWLFTRTANEVGGDLIDFQQLGTDRFGISLADVSGKGLSAALLTAKLQSTLRAIAPDVNSLSELGTKINKIFYRDSLRNMFASLVYVELKSDAGAIRLLNAGHFPPILLKDSKIEEMQKGDPGIGIMPDVKYAEHHLELQKGDLLLIYSDGLIDAKNEAGEFYSAHRLFQLLPALSVYPADEVGRQIIGEINRFVGTAKIYDDLSLVIIKRMA